MNKEESRKEQSPRIFIKEYSKTPHKVLCWVLFAFSGAQMLFAPFLKDSFIPLFTSGLVFAGFTLLLSAINVWKISSDDEFLHVHYSSGKVISIPWREVHDITIVDWNDGIQKNLSIQYGGVGYTHKTLLVGGRFASDKFFLDRLKQCSPRLTLSKY